MQKITETLAHRYSSEITQRELSNGYQHDRVLYGFQKSLVSFALDKSSLIMGRINVLFFLIFFFLGGEGCRNNGCRTMVNATWWGASEREAGLCLETTTVFPLEQQLFVRRVFFKDVIRQIKH